MDTGINLAKSAERKAVKYAIEYLNFKLIDASIAEDIRQKYEEDLKDIELLKNLNDILGWEV